MGNRTASTERKRTLVIPAGRGLQRHLQEGPLLPVYLVTTAANRDPRARRKAPAKADPGELIAARRMIEDTALADADRRLDHAIIDYADENREQGTHSVIANEARITSLLGGRRVVSVTHADDLAFGKAPKRRKKGAAASADPLQALLESLPTAGETPVVLIFQASQFDRRRSAFKELAAHGAVVEVEPPSPRTLSAHIEEQARQYGIRVDRAVAQRLWEQLGSSDPARLRQTADRLLLDVGEGGHLTVSRVMDLVPRDHDSEVFAITDAINEGNVIRAFEVTNLLLERGHAPVAIIGALASHYRALLQIDSTMQNGASHPDEIASQLKLHPYRAKLLCMQLRKMRSGALERAICAVSEADLAVKQTRLGNGKYGPRRWLEETILVLIRGRPLRSRWRPASSMDTL